LICGTQDNIQPDQLLANSSITDHQLHTHDSDEGQMGVNQDGAVTVQQVSYSVGDNLLKLTIRDAHYEPYKKTKATLRLRSRSYSDSPLLKIGGEIGSGPVVGTDVQPRLSGNVRCLQIQSLTSYLSLSYP